MWKKKLCLGIGDFGLSPEDQIRAFAKTGFEGFFTGWGPGAPIAEWRALADELGMIYQSIHAPFGKAADMWKGGEAAATAVNELTACLQDCAKNEVDIMVVHAFIGFKDNSPTDVGVENYVSVVAEAKKLGVRIAFENTEGEEYLGALMKLADSYDNVGFCWDTGHELCYNYGKDMTALYGGRLIATHLNDNLGIRDFGGEITWHDDLHLLPFDGITDWESVAARLAKHGFDGPLTFELNTGSKPERHENDIYKKLSPDEYIAEAYKRACRVAVLMNKCAAAQAK